LKLSAIKPNLDNPRLIKDEKFKKLVQSINDFPKMMELRPIIIDDDNIILGGNMRYRALQELKMKDIPDEWVKKASDLTDEEKKQFIIKDNVGFGEWDFDELANNWNAEDLNEWGLDIPVFDSKDIDLDGMDFEGSKNNTMIIRVECSDEAFNGLKRDMVKLCENYKNAKVL
jgi:ParB-like chromosome segregation protein Spo0J